MEFDEDISKHKPTWENVWVHYNTLAEIGACVVVRQRLSTGDTIAHQHPGWAVDQAHCHIVKLSYVVSCDAQD